MIIRLLICLSLMFRLVPAAQADVLTANLPIPPPPGTGYFKLGTTKNPAGHEISVNSRNLLYDGQPIFPVMGEFHYSRCPAEEWRDELLKMKAGGVDIVATYVFWIHHEEIEGQWDWSGRRDLRKFVQTCNDVGLKVVVRCGPWCHGEVRNGGFPDWVEQKGWKLRTTDTNFLAAVQVLYGQIGQQLDRLLWKDGGPVVGIQLDNEFGGSPAYLLALKKLAIDAGLDVPLYIKTGWPEMRRPVPLGELLPLFGAYADGFWSRSLQPMDGDSWQKFTFKITRTDAGIGNDFLGGQTNADSSGTEKYPYLTCEVGGGMPPSYHRRMNLDPRDVEAVALTQLGSGSSLMGYYMYHGGQNPDGKLSTLQESLTSGYNGYNDLTVKNYDFGAPIGEYGQINPQYHWLRRLHLFLHDFGSALATYPTTLPDLVPTNKTDLATLRWAVRSDGEHGYVFVNNYQRLQPMPPKPNVQFHLHSPKGELTFPDRPVTIPADESFIWPFNLDLGGARLIYATAQPVCRGTLSGEPVFFFAETPGVPTEFAFATTNVEVRGASGDVSIDGNQAQVRNLKPGRGVAIRVNDRINIVLLNEADSLALWRAGGPRDRRLFLTPARVTVDDGEISFTTDQPGNFAVDTFPPLAAVPAGSWTGGQPVGGTDEGETDGIFQRFELGPQPATDNADVRFELVKPAGPPRQIPFSQGKSHIALAPTDEDFTNAAVYKITLPAGIDLSRNPLLRFHYTGDAARLTLNGRLLDDQFYNGRPFDLGLKRYAPEILTGDLRLLILPLSEDAPIYLPEAARPNFGPTTGMATLQSVELISDCTVEFKRPER